jgi:hypothetical protein
MATEHYRDPATGRIFTREVPDGPSVQQLSDANAMRQANLAPPGYSGDRVSFGQSFQAGRALGNEEEIAATLGGELVRTPNGTKYWRQDANSPWKAVNRPGIGIEDVGEFAGSFVPSGIGALAATMARRGPIGMLGSFAAPFIGGMLGQGGSEALQSLEGTQRDTLGGAATNAVIAGAGEGLGGLIGRMGSGMRDYLPGSSGPLPGGDGMAGRVRETLERGATFANENPAFPAPMLADTAALTGAGLPTPVARAGIAQAERLTGQIGAQRADNLDRAMEALQPSGFTLPPGTKEPIAQQLIQAGGRTEQKLLERADSAGPDPRQTSLAATRAAKEGEKAVSGEVRDAYETRLAQAIADEKPVFDLTPAQKSWARPGLTRTKAVRSGLLDSQGNPIMANVVEFVEAAPSPGAKVRRIKDVLATLDPEQTNFDAIKNLRTIVGDIAKSPEFRDFKRSPAARLYSELSDVLRNPKNLDDTSEYIAALNNAEMLATWKAELKRNPRVQTLLQGQGSTDLTRAFAENPSGMLEPAVMDLLAKASPTQRNQFLGGVRAQMLRDRDPYTKLRELRNSGDPDAYKALFPHPTDEVAFEQDALAISAFRKSPVGQMLDQASEPLEAYKKALAGIRNPNDVKQLVGRANTDELDAYRKAIIDDAVTRSLKPRPDGGDTLSASALKSTLADLDERGLLSVLTDSQRRNLVNMENYFRLINSQAGDVGSALETAGVVSKLRDLLNPWQFKRGLDAVHTLATSRLMSRYLSNPADTERLLRRLSAAPRDHKYAVLAGALTGGAATTATGEGIDAAADRLSRAP